MKLQKDHLQHSIQVLIDVVGQHAQHAQSATVQKLGPPSVIGKSVVVRGPVDLYNETCSEAGEISDVRTERYLPAESEPFKLAPPQVLPEP
jgi:hypothetical protein